MCALRGCCYNYYCINILRFKLDYNMFNSSCFSFFVIYPGTSYTDSAALYKECENVTFSVHYPGDVDTSDTAEIKYLNLQCRTSVSPFLTLSICRRSDEQFSSSLRSSHFRLNRAFLLPTVRNLNMAEYPEQSTL